MAASKKIRNEKGKETMTYKKSLQTTQHNVRLLCVVKQDETAKTISSQKTNWKGRSLTKVRNYHKESEKEASDSPDL